MDSLKKKIQLFFEQTINLNRSLVGPGINRFFEILGEEIEIELIEFKSGYKAFDWQVPKGWELFKGVIYDSKGEELISTEKEPLSVWTNSVSVSKNITKEELFKEHISWIEEYPDTIPYNYHYYEERWGFSISKSMINKFTDTNYRIEIDAKHYDDTLKVAKHVVKGKSPKSIIIACHVDHPYQLLDGLSGAGGAISLIEKLKKRENLFTYVFLFFPETIGSLSYFSMPNADKDVCFAIFMDMLCDNSQLTVQKTLTGNTALDKVASNLGENWINKVRLTEFRELPGNDEMVINGPGIGIPSLLVFRWPSKLYHTNSDNIKAYNETSFFESVEFVLEIIKNLEKEIKVINLQKGVINLTKNNLWSKYGRGRNRRSFEVATSLMDGTNSFKYIKEISGFKKNELNELIILLKKQNLVST